MGPFSTQRVRQYLEAGNLLPSDPATLDPKGTWSSVEDILAQLHAATVLAPATVLHIPRKTSTSEESRENKSEPASSTPPPKRSEKLPPVIVPYNQPIYLPGFIFIDFWKKWRILIFIVLLLIVFLLIVLNGSTTGPEVLKFLTRALYATQYALSDIAAYLRSLNPSN